MKIIKEYLISIYVNTLLDLQLIHELNIKNKKKKYKALIAIEKKAKKNKNGKAGQTVVKNEKRIKLNKKS
jgi:hypothetical protein